jgi:hypothetical protein
MGERGPTFNNMKQGDKVICISENFPQWKTTDEDKTGNGSQPKSHPTKGEVLTVDEVLGVFLRFDVYDTDSYNWWMCNRFRKLDLQELMEQEKETADLYQRLINELN